MGRAYSEDLRSRIVTAVEAGATRTAAAAQFAVSVSCAIKLVQRFRQTGSVARSPGQETLCFGRARGAGS
jgi:transposase